MASLNWDDISIARELLAERRKVIRDTRKEVLKGKTDQQLLDVISGK